MIAPILILRITSPLSPNGWHDAQCCPLTNRRDGIGWADAREGIAVKAINLGEREMVVGELVCGVAQGITCEGMQVVAVT